MKPCLIAMALAIGLTVRPATAYEFTTFEALDVIMPAAPRCHAPALLSLPPAWSIGDGAVVLLMPEPMRDAARDQLVAALLAERAAVLEVVPPSCVSIRTGRDTVRAAALGALDAMTTTVGAGPLVVIGYGRGGGAVLDVAREPAASLLGANGPRYVAAISLGDGAPTFVVGSSSREASQIRTRLAALCNALSFSAGAMGSTLERDAPTMAAETCRATMARPVLPGATVAGRSMGID